MSDWKNVEKAVPNEDTTVDVELRDGRRVKGVLYSVGRFWKVRKGQGGHAYDVVRWREISVPKKAPVGDIDERTESTD